MLERWRSGESGPEIIRASARAMPVAPIEGNERSRGRLRSVHCIFMGPTLSSRLKPTQPTTAEKFLIDPTQGRAQSSDPRWGKRKA